MQPTTFFWFRRDLRLHDNAGLYYALKSGYQVQTVFIFDTDILDKLSNSNDRRVEFIYTALTQLQKELTALGTTLEVRLGKPLDIWKQLQQEYTITEVYTNHDYETYAVERDQTVREYLNSNAIAFYTYKDQCIFEKSEILNNQSLPYTVFTPYSKKWKAMLNDFYLSSYPTKKYFQHFLKAEAQDIKYPENFKPKKYPFPINKVDTSIIEAYPTQRDFPAIEFGTSKLSIHLRFGTISIRELAKQAHQHNETFLNELIWREFYFQILHHFPHISAGKSFRAAYDNIVWRNNEAEFNAWCEGKTGYPFVDAGMRELNTTGFMHNRARMIVASFLTKHLLIDWRWGEAYFAEKLLDFDFAANNGGWQWASGSGCDAAPYFRVFNPTLQAQKFDPKGLYIKKWVSELNTFEYPKPIVEHDFARKRAIEVYKKGLGSYEI
jgi:deoxyribodipyrimidine photo-lyase